MSSDFISFKNVVFRYSPDAKPIINHLSFRVQKGERVALQGESGTGKTTVFRLLLGFERPDEGEILYRGRPLNEETVQEMRRRSAWLPQDLDLGSDTVESLVLFPFRFKHNDPQTPSRDEIADTFRKLGLEASLLEQQYADLSTGQRQRTGIAICYLLDKPLVLLDEPTSALDSESKQKVANLLFSDPKKTILSTSHDPWWLEQCDRVFELNTR